MLRNLVHAPRRRFLVEAVKMGEGARAFTDGVAFLNGFDDVGFGKQNRVVERPAAGELRGNRRSKSAARAVRVHPFDVVAAQREHLHAVEEDINRLLHVAALDHHGARALFDQFLRRRLHCRHVLDLHARQQGGLVNIRRDDGGALHQLFGQEFDSHRIQQIRVAGARLDYRVEYHVRKGVAIEELRDHRCVGAVAQHADLHRGDGDVFDERIELRAEDRGGRDVHALYALRGLHGERRHRGDPIAVVRGKGFQVGGNARACARIKPGDAEDNRGG